jgi:hypothetical protein
MEQDVVTIRASKAKLIALGVTALMFILMGVWLYELPPGHFGHLGPLGHVYAVRAVAVAGMVFFGCAGAFAFVKYFDTAPALTIDGRGLRDRSSAVAVGFVPWHDVAGVKEYGLLGQRFVVVMLREPDKYSGALAPWLRPIARINTRMCGSPVILAPTALELEFAQLYRLVEAGLAKYRADRVPAGDA